MSDISKSLIFFGSGPVGLASVQALSQYFDIEAVITKPDPVSSRAPRLVSEWARKNVLDLYQPGGQAELSQLFHTKPFNSQIGVVVDYGYIIPPDVIELFRYGIINSHFSLLPQWRGADPITFALLSGQSETGVSLMLISPGLDEGDILEQSSYKINDEETKDTLTNNLIMVSNELLVYTIPRYMKGEIKPRPQDAEIRPTYSRKLTKQDGAIDWKKSASEIEREVRAYQGWPGSYTSFGDYQVKIHKASVLEIAPGEVGSAFIHEKKLAVYCGKNALLIDTIQPAGKKAMSSSAFLAGYVVN